MPRVYLKDCNEVRKAKRHGDRVLWRHEGHKKRRKGIYSEIMMIHCWSDKCSCPHSVYIVTIKKPNGSQVVVTIDHKKDQVFVP